MAVNEIVVHDHKVQMGETGTEHRAWKAVIRDYMLELLREVELRKIDVYNMDGTSVTIQPGRPERSVVLFHAEHVKRGTGIELRVGDEVVGEYFKEFNTLVVHGNVLAVYNDANKLKVRQIITAWKEAHWDKLQFEHSWIHTSDKDALTNRFTTRLQQQFTRELEENRNQARRYESNINDYKRQIKQAYDNLIRTRNNVETMEKNQGDVASKLIKELDLVVNHPKISDLQIRGGKFNFFIPKVHAYDEDGNRYYIGNMRAEVDIENTEVRFFGDNPRRGFWANDPHPHVNGDDGYPCLGNVASTIAELCSRYEIYALALVCVDFLESVNTSDPAGRKIHLWDKVDEAGRIIKEGSDEDDMVNCDYCEELVEETYTVYNELDGDGDVSGENHVCLYCRGEHYHFDEEVEEYILD